MLIDRHCLITTQNPRMASFILTNSTAIGHGTSAHLRVPSNKQSTTTSNVAVVSQNLLKSSSQPSLSISFESYICSLDNITEDEKGSILEIIPQNQGFLWLNVDYLKKEQTLCLQLRNSNDKNNNNAIKKSPCQLIATTGQGLPICEWFTVDISMFITNDKPNFLAVKFSICPRKAPPQSYFAKFSQLCKDNQNNLGLNLDLTKGKYCVIIGNPSPSQPLSNNSQRNRMNMGSGMIKNLKYQCSSIIKDTNSTTTSTNTSSVNVNKQEVTVLNALSLTLQDETKAATEEKTNVKTGADSIDQGSRYGYGHHNILQMKQEWIDYMNLINGNDITNAKLGKFDALNQSKIELKYTKWENMFVADLNGNRNTNNPIYPTRPLVCVCHDMAGGYKNDAWNFGKHKLTITTTDESKEQQKQSNGAKENDFGKLPLEYSLDMQWSYIDVFVYFSHHFITIPPTQWVNAAHSNNVLILGTIITEHDKGVKINSEILNNPKQFIDTLVFFAQYYGFDGWFLNFEASLESSNTIFNPPQVLATFVKDLTNALHKAIPHSKVIWYDSINYHNGKVQWQSMLNNCGLPFYQACDGLFTDYHWKRDFPAQSLECLRKIDKTLSKRYTIFTGIDIWGRGTYGGGKYNTGEISDIVMNKVCTSVGLFAPGYSFETVNGGVRPKGENLMNIYANESIYKLYKLNDLNLWQGKSYWIYKLPNDPKYWNITNAHANAKWEFKNNNETWIASYAWNQRQITIDLWKTIVDLMNSDDSMNKLSMNEITNYFCGKYKNNVSKLPHIFIDVCIRGTPPKCDDFYNVTMELFDSQQSSREALSKQTADKRPKSEAWERYTFEFDLNDILWKQIDASMGGGIDGDDDEAMDEETRMAIRMSMMDEDDSSIKFVRYLRITERAKDNEYWAGNYGTQIQSPVIRIEAPKIMGIFDACQLNNDIYDVYIATGTNETKENNNNSSIGDKNTAKTETRINVTSNFNVGLGYTFKNPFLSDVDADTINSGNNVLHQWANFSNQSLAPNPGVFTTSGPWTCEQYFGDAFDGGNCLRFKHKKQKGGGTSNGNKFLLFRVKHDGIISDSITLNVSFAIKCENIVLNSNSVHQSILSKFNLHFNMKDNTKDSETVIACCDDENETKQQVQANDSEDDNVNIVHAKLNECKNPFTKGNKWVFYKCSFEMKKEYGKLNEIWVVLNDIGNVAGINGDVSLLLGYICVNDINNDKKEDQEKVSRVVNETMSKNFIDEIQIETIETVKQENRQYEIEFKSKGKHIKQDWNECLFDELIKIDWNKCDLFNQIMDEQKSKYGIKYSFNVYAMSGVKLGKHSSFLSQKEFGLLVSNEKKNQKAILMRWITNGIEESKYLVVCKSVLDHAVCSSGELYLVVQWYQVNDAQSFWFIHSL